MSYPVFYVPQGDVLPYLFGSYDGATGASEALSGLAVTDIEIYKDGSVTQRSSDVGFTLLDTDGIDFDGITGINGFSIDTGDDTVAGFYTVGSWFHVVVSSVTIDLQTVNFVALAFRIMPGEQATGTVSAATSVTSFTITGNSRIRKGAVIEITEGTGAGGMATIFSHNSGTGATVCESPGLPVAPDTTSKYIVHAAPNPQAIQTDASDRVVAIVEAFRSATDDIEFTGDADGTPLEAV